MYKNFLEFNEDFRVKGTEALIAGRIDIATMGKLLEQVLIVAEQAAQFESLVMVMSARGFENFDDKTLEMTRDVNEKLQTTYAEIIGMLSGA